MADYELQASRVPYVERPAFVVVEELLRAGERMTVSFLEEQFNIEPAQALAFAFVLYTDDAAAIHVRMVIEDDETWWTWPTWCSDWRGAGGDPDKIEFVLTMLKNVKVVG